MPLNVDEARVRRGTATSGNNSFELSASILSIPTVAHS